MKRISPDPGVVMVGGGLASQRAAETLRRRGYEGRVRIVCAEPEPPYDRPPLSKEVLLGTAPDHSVSFKAREWYRDQGVELLLGCRATGLDTAARRVRLESGEELEYGALLIATGGVPRPLRLLDHENVHTLRTLEDARRLRAELRPGAHLAIVGAGFIGQEVAASARRFGAEVTIVEALETPLERVLGAPLGTWFADLHVEEGVRMLTGVDLIGVRGEGRVEALILRDGRRVRCDAVLVGIGTEPETAWLAGSPLDGGAVRVDAWGRTEVPDVYAAGDVCAPFDSRGGSHLRTEHWGAAAWQGAAAAKAMLGEEPGPAPLPSFWSDQYGFRIQCVGHPHLADSSVVDGSPAARDFEALFTRDGVPVAGLAVGRPRAIPALRQLIETSVPLASDRKEPVR
jgi:3-phenylpropionate/trans-cinnamate dioxygenase ferredoxin reductase subunit